MTFDTERFIQEVERRNAIWDTTCDEYSDREAKRRTWEDITYVMCEENLGEEEMNEFGKSLQKKWKNIRTSFSRELNRLRGAKSGSAASRKSPYVYFDQLQFLRDTVAINITDNGWQEADSVQTRASIPKKKKLKQNISKREGHDRNFESDSDKLFILSLLDDFRKIPEHRKLSAKIELIETIKRAQISPMESDHSSGAGRNKQMSGRDDLQYDQEY